MRIKATVSDPLFITASIYLAATSSLLWVVVIPLVVGSWFFEPRWDNENGWRFLHEDDK